MTKTLINGYTRQEERLNIWTHGFGFFASIVVLLCFLMKTIPSNKEYALIGSIIFGVSLCILYAASTLYHSSVNAQNRKKLKIFDHASIYVLIAGTYTPYCLITLHNKIGWIVLITVWSMALIGIILKFFFTGRFDRLSTIMYVAMGWVMVLAIKTLIFNLPYEGLLWLVAGGIAYTIGAVFYIANKIKFNHAIFHVFVLTGSFCHVMSVYHFVL